MDTCLEVLNNVFGYEEFRGNQREAIDTVISGKDVILIAPTGGGKSLTYQVPALVLDGLTLVVEPLKALMKDQIDRLQFLGVAVETINSDVKGYDRQNVMNAIRDGEVDLLYVTPEMLAQPKFIEFLKEVDVALIAVDEAHCASAFGNDFRPDYQVLRLLPHHFPGVPRIAVTATADPQTLVDMKDALAMHDAKVLTSTVDRENISMSIKKRVSEKDQKAKILDIIAERSGQSGLVYCLGKATVDKVAAWLKSEGVSALPYHAGYSTDVREANQDAFLNNEVDVLVATVAFGMGVDKSDIRYVIHWDLPASVEAYEQEKGRAGRDGQPADAFMFVGNRDIVMRKRMIKKSKGGAAVKRTDNNKLDMLVGLTETLYCRRRAVLSYFGQTYGDSCGNCDNCAREASGLAVTDEVRDLLAFVENNPASVDTHGLVTMALATPYRHDTERWSMIVRQMVVNGLVEVRHSDCGRLHPTELGRAFDPARGFVVQEKVELTSAKFSKSVRTKSASTSTRRKPSRTRTSAPRETANYWDKAPKKSSRRAKAGSPLLNALRDMRTQIAREERVVGYYVIHDSALKAMSESRPTTGDELLAIKGVGEAKVTRYGHRFLSVINKYAA